jgi:hypothetical protein
MEARFDVDRMVADAVSATEVRRFTFPPRPERPGIIREYRHG